MKWYLADLRDGWRILHSRQFWQDFRHYWSPEQVAHRLYRWVRDIHRPIPVPGPLGMKCWACSIGSHVVAWPCRHYTAATEQIRSRRSEERRR